MTIRTPTRPMSFVAVLASVLLPLSAYAQDGSRAALTDLEQLAERLVVTARVKEGDVALIIGQTHDAELLENLAVHVRKRGAFPFVGYSSDRLERRLFFDVPAEYDSQTDALGLQLAEMIDVVFVLPNGLTENVLEGADPERLAARGQAGEAIGQALFRNNVRTVEIGNGFYPTPWRAERYGMSEAALARVFWQSVNLDYASLQRRAAQVQAALASADKVHITHPNGTDFTVRVNHGSVLVSDGVISDEEMQQGGPAVAVYLPAGEVYTTPVPGTANGTVVHTRDYFLGEPIDDLTLTFRDGRLTSMTGTGPGYDGFRAAYDAVDDPRKDLFGFVDLGINPNVALPGDSMVGSWIPAGTITVGMGVNAWAGGDNTVAYGLAVFLPGSTVTFDGETVIEAGELKL